MIVALVCVYLFLAVPGSASIQLGNITNNKALSSIIIAVVVVGVALLARLCWRWVKKLWIQVKQGGAILQTPGKYFTQVVFPSFLSWLCKLTVIGIFLAAYSIPVTFHSVMTVFGGKALVRTSYDQAKEKSQEIHEEHKQKKLAEKEAKEV